MTALVVDAVTQRFGDVVAVDAASFEVGDEEIVALVGPSGCGKSTLLRTIAGLHGAAEGTITIGGTVVDDGDRHVPPERRRVGLVFQEHALFPHLTVAENVAFGLRDSASSGGRVSELLSMIGLGAHGKRYPHELSGGERQRVALARALAPRPQLMLLDEPFASLDPNLRAQVRADVVEILRAEGIPAVFVTHDQTEALGIGDRVVVMRSGRFEQVGTPEEVFHEPENQFVASFMGEASFLPVVVVEGQPSVELPTADLDGADESMIVMLRPDDVTFEVDELGEAVITHADFRGSIWCYTLRLPSGSLVQSARSHLHRVPVGTRVVPSVSPGHTPVLLDGHTGSD